MFLAAGQTDLDPMYTSWDGTAVTATLVAAAEGAVRANLVTQMETAGLNLIWGQYTYCKTSDIPSKVNAIPVNY